MTYQPQPDFDRLARFYDAEHDGFDADIPLCLGLAQRTGAPILELGCGSGRALAPLAEAGFDVYGVDASAQMLELARQRLQETGLSQRVQLHQQDMRAVKLPQRFHLAFVAVNTFTHLITQADQLQALRSWHEHLRPGGLLVIDVFNPDLATLLESQGQIYLIGQWQDPTSGNQVIKSYSRRHDQATQTQHITFFYDELKADGTQQRTVAPVQMRYLWRAEGELLLQAAGYRVEAVYGDYELNPYDSDSERMIFVATRAQ